MNELITRIHTLTQKLREELDTNRRLASLLLLVPGVLLVQLALMTGDAIDAARADRAALARRAERLESLAHGGDWGRRAAEERARLTQWESQLWHADSPELAAADLQTALQRISAAHLTWNRLKLAPPEPVAAIEGWRIRAEVNGKLGEGGALSLMQDLAEHSPRISIDQISTSQQRGNSIAMQLSVLVTTGDAAP